jgi:hypothetical protein
LRTLENDNFQVTLPANFGGLAPSIDDILQYSNTAHQNVDAYAWSWALALFLMNHPDSSKVFEALLKQPAMNSREVDRWLRARLTW